MLSVLFLKKANLQNNVMTYYNVKTNITLLLHLKG